MSLALNVLTNSWCKGYSDEDVDEDEMSEDHVFSLLLTTRESIMRLHLTFNFHV